MSGNQVGEIPRSASNAPDDSEMSRQHSLTLASHSLLQAVLLSLSLSFYVSARLGIHLSRAVSSNFACRGAPREPSAHHRPRLRDGTCGPRLANDSRVLAIHPPPPPSLPSRVGSGTTGIVATRRGRERANERASRPLFPHLFITPNNAIYCVVHDGDVYTQEYARARAYTQTHAPHARPCARVRADGATMDGWMVRRMDGWIASWMDG